MRLKCTRCMNHRSNTKVKDGWHCTVYIEWDSEYSCTLSWRPFPSEDTAEENLLNNQTQRFYY
jgi:hypothetical protein